MKKYFLILLFFITYNINAQYTLIPDNGFEQMLINQGIDSEGTLDGQVLINDINIITELNINHVVGDGIFINNLTGIEGFTALEILNCSGHLGLGELNLSSNIALKYLNCSSNLFLTNLNLTQNINLEYLECAYIGGGFGFHLDISNNIKLEYLDLWHASLDGLDLSNNINLKELYCANGLNSDEDNQNEIISLDLSNNILLEKLVCGSTLLSSINLPNTNTLTYISLRQQNLSSINISENNNLEHLDLLLNSNLTNIDITNNINLNYLDVNKCALNNLNITQNSLLEELYLGYDGLDIFLDEYEDNNITNINLTNNLLLRNLNALNINLNEIDLTNNTNLELLGLGDNNLTTLDIENNNELLALGIHKNNITEINITNNTQLRILGISENPMGELDLTNNTNLEFLICESTLLNTLNLKNNNNQILTQVYATNNPNLICIEVDNETDANNNTGFYTNWVKDTIAVYSEDCATISIEDETIQHITLYPNPTNNILYIENTNNIGIKHIKVFNLLGQQVLFKKGNFNQLNLSILKPALYLVTIKTNKGIINTKIIKK